MPEQDPKAVRSRATLTDGQIIHALQRILKLAGQAHNTSTLKKELASLRYREHELHRQLEQLRQAVQNLIDSGSPLRYQPSDEHPGELTGYVVSPDLYERLRDMLKWASGQLQSTTEAAERSFNGESFVNAGSQSTG